MDLLRKTVLELGSLSEKYGVDVHYAVKACNEPRVLDLIKNAGFGADCVSGWEVEACVAAGFNPSAIILSGVGKSDGEIRSSLKAGIGFFNVESLEELEVLDGIAAEMGVKACVTLRINPNVDAHTHKYITTGLEDNKFGISDYQFHDLFSLLRRCGNVVFKGLHFHVGSQITDVEGVFSLECRKVNSIVEIFEDNGFPVENVDLGGGLGIDYEHPDEHPIADFEEWFKVINAELKVKSGRKVHVEPGRSLVGQSASLLSRVLFVKKTRTRNFLILDAGMTDLIRPALYGSYHHIENLSAHYLREDGASRQIYDVVGPICESSDVFAENRSLQESFRGDIIALRSAGAYGATMASRYNMRPIAPSVFSDDLK